jgi:acetolactate synthase I/II/III large subunit
MQGLEQNVGEALISLLEQAGVSYVFGIPGVHTIELYRSLAASSIRHITPRHEQGAGFMADGYARISGKPGVCLLITGPGLTNAITAMAQARADSIPMLVITGVNARKSLGKGYGHLHELPDQSALAKQVAKASFTVMQPQELALIFAEAWSVMTKGRPGPVHIEIPTDVMKAKIAAPKMTKALSPEQTKPNHDQVLQAVEWLNAAKAPLIIAGGGAIQASNLVRQLAEILDAPLIQTINARGILNADGKAHPLSVPASPSLKAVRDMINAADCVIALGTEFGPTDFDMYETGTQPNFARLIRVDIDSRQLARRNGLALKQINIEDDVARCITGLLPHLIRHQADGPSRAVACNKAAIEEIGPRYRKLSELCTSIWQALPKAAIVGDSTQVIYAANLFLEAPRPRAWFNSATGYGTLGYAIPAAIGAALADNGKPVVAMIGDGGAQFTLAELGSAVDAKANVAFIIWNNHGYQEIEQSMINSGVEPEGVKPTPPDFAHIALAYGMSAYQPRTTHELQNHLQNAPRPCLIVLNEADFAPLSKAEI